MPLRRASAVVGMRIYRSLLPVVAALGSAGCLGAEIDENPKPARGPDGSTRTATWVDTDRDGKLDRGPGEPLVERTEVAPSADQGAELATFVHLADVHVTDEESPARVEMLDRLGTPTRRPSAPRRCYRATSSTEWSTASRPSGRRWW